MDVSVKKVMDDLVENAKVAFVSCVDPEGFPATKAMLALEHDGLKVHYFSTNTAAQRTQRFRENPKACVYYCDQSDYKGLLLTGEMEVTTDMDLKKRLMREGFEMYYPKGVDDEDYSVLKFTARKGNYYHGLHNESFDVE